MKKLVYLSIAFISLSSHSLFSQEIAKSEVPSVVLNKFQQTYPKTTMVEWSLKYNGQYKAEFETGLAEYDHNVWFDKTGKLLKHEEEIAKNELPTAIKNSISNNFKGYRIDEAEKITEQGKTVYKLNLEKMDNELEVIIDSNGGVVQKVVD